MLSDTGLLVVLLAIPGVPLLMWLRTVLRGGNHAARSRPDHGSAGSGGHGGSSGRGGEVVPGIGSTDSGGFGGCGSGGD